MKIDFRLLSLAFFITFSFNLNSSFAQIKFGPLAGLNISELPNNTEYIIGQHHIYSGYHLGVITEIRLFKEFYLQPGVLFIKKGSKYIVGNSIGGNTAGFSNFQFSCSNLEIPINIMYKIGKGSLKVLFFAGPHFGYGLNGKWKSSNGTSSNIHFGNDPVDDLKSFDYGPDVGAGLEFGRVQISSQYYASLRTLSTLTPPLKEQKYRVLSISIAYLFTKEKRYYCAYEDKIWQKYHQNKGHRKKY